MPLERFANKAQSTLVAPVMVGDKTLEVVSDADFPTEPNFRIIIEEEILLVTKVESKGEGALYTVERGVETTSAAEHGKGRMVTHVLTASGLATYIAAGDAAVAAKAKEEIEALLPTLNALVFKGVIDCSANPKYPAANAGDAYIVSVAGKIGGASGTAVEVGDLLLCNTDGAAEGTKAEVGAKWDILQVAGIVAAEQKRAEEAEATKADLVEGALDESQLPASVVSGSPTGGFPAWVKETQYALNTVVTNGGSTWICKTAHKSAATFAADEANWQAIGSAGSSLLVPNEQTIDYTAVLADNGKVIEVNAATLKVVTIPKGVFAVGTVLYVAQMGNGAVEVAPASGVTFDPAESFIISGKYQMAAFRCRATNEWVTEDSSAAIEALILAETARAEAAEGLGGASWTATAVSYTLLITDRTVGVTNTSAERVITLPEAAAAPVGVRFAIKDESGGAATKNIKIVPKTPASEKIDGVESLVISTNYGSAVLYSNGSNWFTV